MHSILPSFFTFLNTIQLSCLSFYTHTRTLSPTTLQDKLKLYPAITRPNPVQDLDATIYAQMRTLHFLKWNKPAPEALLKECGPCTHAFAMGARKAMVLPTHIKVRQKKSFVQLTSLLVSFFFIMRLLTQFYALSNRDDF